MKSQKYSRGPLRLPPLTSGPPIFAAGGSGSHSISVLSIEETVRFESVLKFQDGNNRVQGSPFKVERNMNCLNALAAADVFAGKCDGRREGVNRVGMLSRQKAKHQGAQIAARSELPMRYECGMAGPSYRLSYRQDFPRYTSPVLWAVNLHQKCQWKSSRGAMVRSLTRKRAPIFWSPCKP
jgi:hypothetical protein